MCGVTGKDKIINKYIYGTSPIGILISYFISLKVAPVQKKGCPGMDT